MKIKYLFFLVIALILTSFGIAYAQQNDLEKQYDKKLININTKLFYSLKIGMNYDESVNIVGKKPLYCLSDNNAGIVLNLDKINAARCHWDGKWIGKAGYSSLNIIYSNSKISYFNATVTNGDLYTMNQNGKVTIIKYN